MYTLEHRQRTITNDADFSYGGVFIGPNCDIWLRDYTYEDTILHVDFIGIEFSIKLRSKLINESEEYMLED